jgi:protein gp37
MGSETGISWTDKTANFLIGCSRVSEGCRHCYAEQMAATKFRHFTGGPVWGRQNPRYETSEENWKKPLRWARRARQTGERVLVFGNSLYDVFEDHPTVDKVRPRIWELVDQTRDSLTWQFVTKRPERIAACLPATWGPFWGGVWLGTSVESEEHANRVDHLRAVGAAVRFLSVEPALGPVAHAISLQGIDWVIWGGESGKGWRPADLQWARDLLAACRAQGTAFFFKQSSGPRSGMGAALDGREFKEFPTPRTHVRPS